MKRDTDVIIPLEILILNDLLSQGVIDDLIHSRAVEMVYRTKVEAKEKDFEADLEPEKDF